LTPAAGARLLAAGRWWVGEKVPTAAARAKRYSELADECHKLAELQTDPLLRGHYEAIANHYLSLAEGELRLAEREATAQSQRNSMN
jgi:hypothetical protein